MTLSALGIFSAAGAGGAPAGAYELISTSILGSSQSSVVFNVSSFASTYRHLQIRAVGRVTANGGGGDAVRIRLNADTGNNYAVHQLFGNGASVISSGAASQSGAIAQRFADNSASANIFGVFVADILDPYSTTKNKTLRFLGGMPTPGEIIALNSGLWMNTAAVTSITLSPATVADFLTGSRFSLYGIKG